MDQKFAKWEKWLETIYYEEVIELVDSKHIFWNIQNIINNNPKIQKANSFYQFVGYTYFDYAVSAIRRQIKSDKQSISLVRLLEEIIETPSVFSRNRFVTLYRTDMQHGANRIFTTKWAGNCSDHIDPDIVQQHLDELHSSNDKLSNKVMEFADRRVAHRDKRQSRIPTFGELDTCINCLKKLVGEYWLLFMAEDLSNCFVPQRITEDYWEEIFRQPWILSDEPYKPSNQDC